MKLYTESQVKDMLDKMNVIYSLKDLTPIELPTHQEIEKEAFQVPYNGSNEFYDKSFIRGAKWVIDKIKKTEIRNFRITTKTKQHDI